MGIIVFIMILYVPDYGARVPVHGTAAVQIEQKLLHQGWSLSLSSSSSFFSVRSDLRSIQGVPVKYPRRIDGVPLPYPRRIRTRYGYDKDQNLARYIGSTDNAFEVGGYK
ncbi:hypothetical protein RHMOL_Rhmol02G0135400 [Rhododendron molle]|uniref:Uncharacterized protein n=1 Tax=Rhododendron molle TaxID=49168 RepID=A0ACC0PPJ9_RHOML|nr:hypothetical protein RHMOL_Rhmol02G0135400 [Rhododendron molle]